MDMNGTEIDPNNATSPTPAGDPISGTDTTDIAALSSERRELLETLAAHRGFLRTTVQGMTEEQVRMRPTASELTLGGIIKHVAAQERQWIDFVVDGTSAMPDFDPATSFDDWGDDFRVTDDDTLGELLERYEEVARRTESVIAGLADLDHAHPLPTAPWFEPGATRSARRVVLHLIAETSQHAGHADILRESIDGAKTMG
jgi:hypothetical protein